MSDKAVKVIGAILVMIVLFGFYSCSAWRFNECKKVGHSTAYCIYEMGK